jgi:hypothetical protein
MSEDCSVVVVFLDTTERAMTETGCCAGKPPKTKVLFGELGSARFSRAREKPARKTQKEDP